VRWADASTGSPSSSQRASHGQIVATDPIADAVSAGGLTLEAGRQDRALGPLIGHCPGRRPCHSGRAPFSTVCRSPVGPFRIPIWRPWFGDERGSCILGLGETIYVSRPRAPRTQARTPASGALRSDRNCSRPGSPSSETRLVGEPLSLARLDIPPTAGHLVLSVLERGGRRDVLQGVVLVPATMVSLNGDRARMDRPCSTKTSPGSTTRATPPTTKAVTRACRSSSNPACNDEGISRRDDGAGIRRVNRQLEIRARVRSRIGAPGRARPGASRSARPPGAISTESARA